MRQKQSGRSRPERIGESRQAAKHTATPRQNRSLEPACCHVNENSWFYQIPESSADKEDQDGVTGGVVWESVDLGDGVDDEGYPVLARAAWRGRSGMRVGMELVGGRPTAVRRRWFRNMAFGRVHESQDGDDGRSMTGGESGE